LASKDAQFELENRENCAFFCVAKPASGAPAFEHSHSSPRYRPSYLGLSAESCLETTKSLAVDWSVSWGRPGGMAKAATLQVY
jgi:hypothetical protein